MEEKKEKNTKINVKIDISVPDKINSEKEEAGRQ